MTNQLLTSVVKVVVRRSAKQLFWPDRLLKKAEEWGKKEKSAVLRGQIKFLNRHGLKFDRDNDDLKEIELSKTDEKLVQPDYIAEVPGIEVQGDYDQIIGPKPDAETHKKIPSVTQRMAEAIKKMMVVTWRLTPNLRPEE